MAEIGPETIERWRRSPTQLIEEGFADPETGRAYKLLPSERAFLAHAFERDASGRLRYPEQVYACPKKSGKTAFAALHALALVLLYGGRFAEAIVVANDFEQAQGRVFEAMRRIVETSPWLRKQAKITSDKIAFPSIGASIRAIPSDYASAAGSNANIAVFDELWAYTSERSHRLWDEMVPPPTRKVACRLTVTYAGFSGESELLEGLYKRGMALPEIGEGLRAGDGLLFFWSHEPVAPWQTPEWIEEMRRSLRPNQYLRMVENRFVTSESTFIDMRWWDDCTHPDARMTQADKALPVHVGVDASVKRDSTAIVAAHYDKRSQHARLIWHRIFQPSPEEPIDFEREIEATLRDLAKRFRISSIYFDPFQMMASAQRLMRDGLPMIEFAQSVPNLTQASQNLFETIKARNITAYPDDDIRLAMSRAVAIESARGWRIAKEKQAHKIDVVVAMAMALLAAVQGEAQYGSYDTTMSWVDGRALGESRSAEERAERDRRWRANAYWQRIAPPQLW